MQDIANYVVASLSRPALSANKHLNFPSETLSQNALVELVAHPEEAPSEIAPNSNIPVDFYFVVKSIQGSGTFRRSRWDCHWDLFPEVKRVTFEEYMKERFGG